ncbi:uncharacterized protein LOC111378424 [Olea europaea var. sylvestris]|uniref:uncharacterized protein LOC111378424 n=1 Tax=Olea europaea var. sylvestris TaxID=158386 RepID=UPI000C1D234B|nr:uncharacterized protein LOC111378424 [Olea europaea var. sylvestris]
MLGFIALSSPSQPIRNPLISRLPSYVLPIRNLKFHLRNPNPKKLFFASAQNGNENDNGLTSESNIETGGRVNDEKGKENNGRPRLNLKWVDLLLDPDPDNLVAVGLTGLLTWASVQVLWQLFIVSIAILLAALKYTLVAALLIFILITLL